MYEKLNMNIHIYNIYYSLTTNMNIPTIDLNNIDSIINGIKCGFFYVDIDETDIDIIQAVLNKTINYFEQNTESKKLDKRTEYGLGYLEMGRKLKNKLVEMNESFTYRPDYYHNNKLLDEYMERMEKYATNVFTKIMHAMNIEYDNKIINPSFNTLNLLHYSKNEEIIGFDFDDLSSKQNQFGIQIGVHPHTDWGFFTFLVTNNEGLQILVDDTYITVPIEKNKFIVNIGDMCERLSGGKMKSTTHRVILGKEKYSIAYFFEPNIDTEICGLKFGDYLNKKIEENE